MSFSTSPGKEIGKAIISGKKCRQTSTKRRLLIKRKSISRPKLSIAWMKKPNTGDRNTKRSTKSTSSLMNSSKAIK